MNAPFRYGMADALLERLALQAEEQTALLREVVNRGVAVSVLSDLFETEHGRLDLGGTATIGPTAREDGGARLGPERCLRIHAKDRCRPVLVTVSFDVKLISDLTTSPVHTPRAKITWGSYQGGGEVFVDLRHGLRVALEATDVQVDAIYRVLTGFAGTTDGPNIRVVTSVGLGSVSDQNLTLTEDSQTVLALAATTEIVVPSYARSIEVQSDADPTIAAPNRFRVELFRGTVAGGRVLAMYDERDLPVTIPNGGETLRIVNLGPGTAVYTPIFHLTL